MNSGLEVSTLDRENHSPWMPSNVGLPNPTSSTISASPSPPEFTESRPYEPLIHQLVRLPLPSLLELAWTPEKSLAIMILLDQISRNTMRGPAAAWIYTTCDPVAIQVAHHCIKQDHVKAHPPYQQFWYYMPLTHSESISDQELNLAKNAELAWTVRHDGDWKGSHVAVQTGLDHSIKFHRIIEKFGRFPNRNAVLKRESTEEETAFLEGGGWGFGWITT
jgi:uncharacterized protein (DUF924 family)